MNMDKYYNVNLINLMRKKLGHLLSYKTGHYQKFITQMGYFLENFIKTLKRFIASYGY